MGLLTERNLAVSAATDDLIHIVKTGDTSQSPFGSSYKATLGQVLALVPQSSGYTQVQDEGVDLVQRDTLNFVGSGVTASDSGGVTTVTIPGGPLGGFLAVREIDGYEFTSTPTIRPISSGNTFIFTYPSPDTTILEYGSLTGTFNTSTSTWICPNDGYYDVTVLFSLALKAGDYNSLTGSTNPNGYVGLSGTPDNTYNPSFGNLEFKNYFGKFLIGVYDNTKSQIICANSYQVDYNTSQIIISATYTNRYIEKNQELKVRWLNTCRNTVYGVNGNSIHFTVTHLR